MAVMTMGVSEWIALRNNPRQRDTIRRAKFAANNHLKTPSEVHRFVFAAVKDGNLLCKLDGHTRAYLWDAGVLQAPHDGKVDVCLLQARSMKHAAQLYDQLDNAKARKQPKDEIYGAAREHNFEMQSSLLRSCAFMNQLRMAEAGGVKSSGLSAWQLVGRWKDELIALDGLSLTRTYTTLISAMLVTIRVYGVECAGGFWTTLDDGEGNKVGKKMDGPCALQRMMEVRTAEGRTAGYDNLYDMFRRAWTAFVVWKDGKMVQGLRASDVSHLSKYVGKERAK